MSNIHATSLFAELLKKKQTRDKIQQRQIMKTKGRDGIAQAVSSNAPENSRNTFHLHGENKEDHAIAT